MQQLIIKPLILALALLAAGCQSLQPRGPAPLEEADVYLDKAAAEPATPVAAQPPASVEQALMPALPAAVTKADTREQLFDVSVNQIPAREFFLGLVDGTSYNMVIHPEVTGDITLNLRRVSIPTVMEIVRDVFGYDYQRTRYGYQVLPARLRTRVFQVNFPNMLRSGTSQTRVSSGQVTQSDAGSAESDSSSGASDSSAGGGSGEVTGTEINTVQPETSYWQELDVAINAILGDADGRTAVVNPQTGVVVVRAMPTELQEIEAFLKTTEAISTRQVVLEAKILEVELDDGFRSGVNWAVLARPGPNSSITAAQVGGGTELDGVNDLNNLVGASPTAGTDINLGTAALNTFAGAAATTFGGVFSLAVNLGDFSAFIEMLQTQGNVQVLSSPRVATLNNQKAVIKVGTDEFFVTDISSTTTTGATTTTTPDIELTPFFSGIALDVTPQISAEGDVILHVHPSVSEVRDQPKTITVSGTPQNLPLALSTVRESDSVVRARSGQVVVIGGLMRNQWARDKAEPPMFGAALGHERETGRKTELVILLKPIVIDDDSTWAKMLSADRHRFGDMREAMRRREE